MLPNLSDIQHVATMAISDMLHIAGDVLEHLEEEPKRIYVVLALSVAVGCAATCLGLLLHLPKSRKSKDLNGAETSPASACRDFRLCPPEVLPMKLSDEQLPFLEKEVVRIYAVDHSKPPLGTGARPGSSDFRPKSDVIESLRKLRALCAEFDKESAAGKWRLHEPIDDLFLARQLIAADFDLPRAKQLVQGYISWRRELRGGVPPALPWLKLGIGILPFEDIMGRPVILARARYFSSETPDDLFRGFYRGIVDAVIGHLLLKRDQELSATNPLEQYVLVLDVMGATRKNFAMSGVKVMISESTANYPDRLAQIYLLGVNMGVQALWAVVSPMVHPRTRKKVELVSAAKAPEVMQHLVGGAERLPREYGGTGTDLASPDKAKTLEERGGKLAARVWQETGVDKFVAERPIRVAWDCRSPVAFKIWQGSKGETTAVVRSADECAAFLMRLGRGLQGGIPGASGRRGRCNSSGWSGALFDGCCMAGRDGNGEDLDPEQHAANATRTPEDLEERLAELLADCSGLCKQAVLDFVSGQKPKQC
eukprot:TRINITY_DN20238_c0_g1_i1.p1 TRINITY_DN20238_c0_g1~~TRINITY_DN20238_c0_g1_i1.p1  ORF type:complete len:555 (+),score=94.34 TRINITY_DN20238_c0_g1_i1:51-1667(+)